MPTCFSGKLIFSRVLKRSPKNNRSRSRVLKSNFHNPLNTNGLQNLLFLLFCKNWQIRNCCKLFIEKYLRKTTAKPRERLQIIILKPTGGGHGKGETDLQPVTAQPRQTTRIGGWKAFRRKPDNTIFRVMLAMIEEFENELKR